MKQWIAVLMALLAVGTLTAQISIPNTFTANTRIVSADVNENFNELGSKALNREGGAMSGDLAVENLTFGAHNTYDIGSTGTRARDGWFGRNVAITGTLGVTGVTTVGTINATTITGGGSGITSLAEANISDGTVFPRLAADETITGTYTIDQAIPALRFRESDGGSDTKRWALAANSDIFLLALVNDANDSSANMLTFSRTGTTPGTMALTGNMTASGSLGVGGGTAITAVLMGTKSWNPGSLADNASETTTVTVTGVSSSAACFASSLVSESATPKNDFFFSVYYASSSTVNVTLLNKSGATVNPDNNTLRVTCFNY